MPLFSVTRKGLVTAILVIGAPALATESPPAVFRNLALQNQLDAAYDAMPDGYTPRTHLLDNAGRAKYVNRLINEASPYLLQHAHNPVDWRPWSEETLSEAKARGVPIFLSVGYATCHWCHVMEEESFDNEEVAELLNTSFIAIKIDREQHPDLDHLYITATQLQQGHAGWPNSLWLMSNGLPFHTGTYIPREQFMQILAAIAQSWSEPAKRPEIESIANQLGEAIKRFTQLGGQQSAPLDETVYVRAAEQLLSMHNALEGGFSQSQQFPQEGFLLYLMEHWRRTGDQHALQVAIETLDAIAAGGIHDHIGGGFHRYTIDPNWRTPHFEKMLYNQGLLSRAFIEAWEITGENAYRRAAERTFTYVLRDMTDGEGAFYAAEDADSLDQTGDLAEGAFYAWTPEQFDKAGATKFATVLGISEAPTLDVGAVAHFTPSEPVDFETLDPVLDALRLARDARIRPLRDEKVIAGWNGLMIRAMAEGAVAFEKPALAEAAARAGNVVWTRLWDKGHLSRFWAVGQSREDAVLEDYAWLGLAFLALSDQSFEHKWLDRAKNLFGAIQTQFADGSGRLKMAARDGPLGPIYDNSDGATPSGESAALEFFARLYARTGDPEVDLAARNLFAALAGPISGQPLLRTDALIGGRMLDSGASGYRQTLSKGKVSAHLQDAMLHLRIAEGWHINAHDPGQDWLIGVDLAGAEVDWPAGTSMTLGFSKDQLNVYEGDLTVPLQRGESEMLSLTVQACSHEVCLEPETATFRLP